MLAEYTDFQRLIHCLPENLCRFLGGGRGGGKSTSFAQDIYIRSERYKEQCRYLYLRQGPWKALKDFIATLNNLFDEVYGPKRHQLNGSTKTWTTPSGAYIELGILPDGEQGTRYYEKTYQGRSFTDIAIDEVPQWSRPAVLDLMVSNLRGSIPTRLTLGGNPGGIGHQWVAQRYVQTGYPSWTPFDIPLKIPLGGGRVMETKRRWIYCPSTFRDNPHNGPDYLTNLAFSAAHDLELLKAWISGSWNIARGAYFAAVLANPYIEVDWPRPSAWHGEWDSRDWRWWLAHDHGTAAPAVTYVMARSPGADGPDGLFYPRDSVVLVDEYACHKPGNLGEGYGWTVPRICEGIKELAKRWMLPPRGVADDACFGQMGHTGPGGRPKTIADEYAQAGVTWRPAKKGGRAPRFLKMKRLLGDCGNIEKPGLYVARSCRYWWSTVPYLVHDPKDREVVLKCETDHGLDASSYGLEGDAPAAIRASLR